MSLERIEITTFAVIAGEILQHRRTGFLTVHAPPLRKSLYWVQGDLVMSVSSRPEDSLAEFLVRRGALTPEREREIFGDELDDAVARLHEAGLLDLSSRQTLLRDWLAEQLFPLFSLDEGTAAFTEDEALPPEKRVFLPSTAALVIEGVRSITNGLVLRRSLGDLKRTIQFARESRFSIESLPMTDQERTIAASLQDPLTIEAFLREHAASSGAAARVAVALLALGVFTELEDRALTPAPDDADMQRDLELLAAIGSSDPRSLRAVAFSRQLKSFDHYQVLEVPRAATRSQIVISAESLKKKYDPSTYPPVVWEAIQAIQRRIDEAAETLKDASRRAHYDRLIQSDSGGGADSIQQRLTRRSIAEQNFAKARELTVAGDYYGAIVLLKQAVTFAPDNANAWHLLGACQERNPKWQRDAAESFQRALSIDPDNVDALISLGDLYRNEGLASRAQTCYEDVLKIAPDNPQAKSRLQGLKKR